MKSASRAGTGGLGGVPSYAFPSKRRWIGLVIGVLGLVILSMLVHLVFLVGLHNGFHSAGRPKRKRRESQFQKKKVYHCDRCHEPGHSVKTCKNPNPS